MSKTFVVTGAGPVGWTVAGQLAGSGHGVRILTRSGSGPTHPLVEAAQEAGAVVVFPESLYSYSEPHRVMTESSPRSATGGKRGLRTELLQARDASTSPTVSVAAGDFFGPRVRMAHGGERIVVPILAGRNVSVVGSARQPHSFTYVADLARAMITAAGMPSAWNSVWHAPTGPAITQRELAHAFAAAAGQPEPKVRALPGWVLRAGGIFSTDARELAETLYQFEKPFVMDSSLSEATLGLAPTPLPEAAAATVEWWRQQG
jgi:nucleoside-diphosphate-sugar epimerase